MSSVVVAGASNQIAAYLIPMLLRQGNTVTAISRRAQPAWVQDHPSLLWLETDLAHVGALPAGCAQLIYLAPGAHLKRTLTQFSPSRVVLMTSTSAAIKADSDDPAEQGVAAVLQRAELDLADWASAAAAPFTVLRPTMIYGAGLDSNLTRMARLIKRFRCALISGGGSGKRQPVHAEDVAAAVVGALEHSAAINQSYDLSGASTISYREMVKRVFASLDRPIRIINLPHAVASPVASALSVLPMLRGLKPTMLRRMSEDLVFDHTAAKVDLGFSPRPFRPTASTWQLLTASDFAD